MTESWRRESPRHSSTRHAAVPTVVQLCLLACLRLIASSCPSSLPAETVLTALAAGRSESQVELEVHVNCFTLLLRFGSLRIREKVILPEVRFYF